LTTAKVHELLKLAGYDEPEEGSYCVKRAILRGFGFAKITCTADLDKPVLRVSGAAIESRGVDSCCRKLEEGEIEDPEELVYTATLRTMLDQPDNGGGDYEEPYEGKGALKCPCFDPGASGRCWGVSGFVTGACEGTPRLEDMMGKFHNHCRACPDFGKCLGDYRVQHDDRRSGSPHRFGDERYDTGMFGGGEGYDMFGGGEGYDMYGGGEGSDSDASPDFGGYY
jgi:hypothetical protein